MKLHLIFIYIAIVSVSLASCKKDSSSPAPVKMSASIDGKTWSPSDLGVAAVSSTSAGTITITGTDLTSSLVIIIHGTTTGTYTLTLLSQQCGATYTPSLLSYTDTYVGISGTVKLTKVTTNLISGTFEFTLTNNVLATKSITKGQFNDVTYF